MKWTGVGGNENQSLPFMVIIKKEACDLQVSQFPHFNTLGGAGTSLKTIPGTSNVGRFTHWRGSLE